MRTTINQGSLSHQAGCSNPHLMEWAVVAVLVLWAALWGRAGCLIPWPCLAIIVVAQDGMPLHLQPLNHSSPQRETLSNDIAQIFHNATLHQNTRRVAKWGGHLLPKPIFARHSTAHFPKCPVCVLGRGEVCGHAACSRSWLCTSACTSYRQAFTFLSSPPQLSDFWPVAFWMTFYVPLLTHCLCSFFWPVDWHSSSITHCPQQQAAVC